MLPDAAIARIYYAILIPRRSWRKPRPMAPDRLTDALKEEALRLGFDLVGVCAATAPPGIERFRAWLAAGHAGSMHYLADRAELLGRAGDLFEWMAAGELQVRIDRTFPLSEAAEAHRYLEARKTQGKLLLIP